jgi:hypothetical protein
VNEPSHAEGLITLNSPLTLFVTNFKRKASLRFNINSSLIWEINLFESITAGGMFGAGFKISLLVFLQLIMVIKIRIDSMSLTLKYLFVSLK